MARPRANLKLPWPFIPGRRSGLVGWWPGEPGGGKLLDQSGLGNHGTLTNGPTWTAGKDGGKSAILFDGSNDFVAVASVPVLICNGDKTLCAWIRTAAAGASYRDILNKQFCYVLALKDNVLQTYDWVGTGDKTSGVNLADNLWHHVALTVRAGEANGSRLYVDGFAVGSAFTYQTQVDIGRDVMVGATRNLSNVDSLEYFAGRIEEPRVYNYALSAASIQALYSPLTRWDLRGKPGPQALALPTVATGGPAPHYVRRVLSGGFQTLG